MTSCLQSTLYQIDVGLGIFQRNTESQQPDNHSFLSMSRHDHLTESVLNFKKLLDKLRVGFNKNKINMKFLISVQNYK